MIADEIETALNELKRIPYPQARRNLSDLYADFELFDDFVVGTASKILIGRFDSIDLNYQSDLDVKFEGFKPLNQKDSQTFEKMIEYKKELNKLLALIKKAYRER